MIVLIKFGNAPSCLVLSQTRLIGSNLVMQPHNDPDTQTYFVGNILEKTEEDVMLSCQPWHSQYLSKTSPNNKTANVAPLEGLQTAGQKTNIYIFIFPSR